MSGVRKLLATGVVAMVLAAIVGASFSAFTATTTNSGNNISAGTVAIGDNDSSSALFNVSNIKPGDSISKCLNVTYTGNMTSNVRLYGSSSGALAPYLNLKVARGNDSSPSFPSCSGFAPIEWNYHGYGDGVLYDGDLSAYPTDWTSGVVDLSVFDPAEWTQNVTQSYMLTLTVDNNSAAQGLSSSINFTWEARNQ